jgi:hypothetical protein
MFQIKIWRLRFLARIPGLFAERKHTGTEKIPVPNVEKYLKTDPILNLFQIVSVVFFLFWFNRNTEMMSFDQGCGSGLDPDSVTLWIRIRIGNPDPGARNLRNFIGKTFSYF